MTEQKPTVQELLGMAILQGFEPRRSRRKRQGKVSNIETEEVQSC
jgi:hypothetical protein